MTFQLGDDPQTISFKIDEMHFDTAAIGAIRDAFEAALVDQDGNSVVPTFTHANAVH